MEYYTLVKIDDSFNDRYIFAFTHDKVTKLYSRLVKTGEVSELSWMKILEEGVYEDKNMVQNRLWYYMNDYVNEGGYGVINRGNKYVLSR